MINEEQLNSVDTQYYDENEAKEFWMWMHDWPNKEGVNITIHEIDRSEKHELADKEPCRYGFSNDDLKNMCTLFNTLRNQ